MVIRNGFVSNSSSSSFIVDTKYLSKDQIEKLLVEPAEDKNSDWQVKIITDLNNSYIIGDAPIMDNLGIEEYLENIKVDLDKVLIGDSYAPCVTIEDYKEFTAYKNN